VANSNSNDEYGLSPVVEGSPRLEATPACGFNSGRVRTQDKLTQMMFGDRKGDFPAPKVQVNNSIATKLVIELNEVESHKESDSDFGTSSDDSVSLEEEKKDKANQDSKV